MHKGGEPCNALDLELAVLRVLSQAGKLQAKSVALPLMGAGRARWPIDTAAKLQVAAVLRCFHQSNDSSLRVSSHAAGGSLPAAQCHAMKRHRGFQSSSSACQASSSVTGNDEAISQGLVRVLGTRTCLLLHTS